MAKHLPRFALGERDADVPLLNLEKRFGVFWSPKSACSTVMIWYYHTIGRLKEARAFDKWPHKWRIRCSTRPRSGWKHAASLASLMTTGPFSGRLATLMPEVSAYFVWYTVRLERERFGEFLGRAQRAGIILEFLDFVAGAEIASLNPHIRPQRKALETHWREADKVVNISRSDLFFELNNFEQQVGLGKTDFAALSWIEEVNGPRRIKKVTWDHQAANVPFTREAAADGSPWPNDEAFLTKRAKKKIEQIYAVDFMAYGRHLD